MSYGIYAHFFRLFGVVSKGFKFSLAPQFKVRFLFHIARRLLLDTLSPLIYHFRLPRLFIVYFFVLKNKNYKSKN